MTINVVEKQPEPMLKVSGLQKYYSAKQPGAWRSKPVKAVDDVSFQLYEGETYGLVGESGCGKSTLGRTLLRLTEPTAGSAVYQGEELFTLSSKSLQTYRKQLQMVFQDPFASLHPRKTIGSALTEPLVIHQIGTQADRYSRVINMLRIVGLQPDHYDRLPHELSGGQRQRVVLARALILEPKLVICDEPVSALDVIIQAQILNLMKQLQQDLGLTYLFIAHDVGVVRHISDRIGVMYLGKLVEEAPTDELFANPLHPYTRALLSAVPNPDPASKRERILLKGDIPSPLNPPSGCSFHPRCPLATNICREKLPQKREAAANHYVACHLA
ncbi:ABC transporter ATP-binding protein [Paenibacillus sinopodophylli]|uniref:ABC transporter ATP-binding protein n=1 Tax=Paenibacillus sinopodophylli TaxID=1837342 RepID=UPI00110CCE80|nr:dipeptide ABC transporter ATP-binding protein [Paenibacillus sinopodophylli]